MEQILRTEHLTKRIGGKILADDVSLSVRRGEIYGFLGPNGAGKTTIMRMITNLWKPSDGRVVLFGETLKPNSYSVLKRMGSIIEFPYFYPALTGRENLQLHSEYMGYARSGCVDDALELLGLDGAADRKVKEYSLGMRQRLGIARAVLTKPELLVLDEPTNGLDPAGIHQIRELLKSLCTQYGLSIFISSHMLGEMQDIADTIGILHHGKLLKQISMQQIVQDGFAYVELKTPDAARAACLLNETYPQAEMKAMDAATLRIYAGGIAPQEISEQIARNGLRLDALTVQAETLEDYFLKLTEEDAVCGN